VVSTGPVLVDLLLVFFGSDRDLGAGPVEKAECHRFLRNFGRAMDFAFRDVQDEAFGRLAATVGEFPLAIETVEPLISVWMIVDGFDDAGPPLWSTSIAPVSSLCQRTFRSMGTNQRLGGDGSHAISFARTYRVS
jgi:hypothetical protein